MKVKLMVDGQEISVDLEKELTIVDVGVDMDQVASKMAYWAALWAAAEGERVKTDAFYRNWRANMGQELLAADPKLSEWKVKQRIEADAYFSKIKEAIAKATYNSTLTKSVYDSFRIKANALQSKGAMMRAELDATGMTTPGKPKKRAKAERDARVDKMRKDLKKTRNEK